MDRREFLKGFTIIGASAVLVPSSVLLAKRAQELSKEFLEFSSQHFQSLNEYAAAAILPSLASLALYAYTMELMYLLLTIFLLITTGIVV